jgi:hypothetical protein
VHLENIWLMECLCHHHPKPLEEATQAELKRILRAAERELE